MVSNGKFAVIEVEQRIPKMWTQNFHDFRRSLSVDSLPAEHR